MDRVEAGVEPDRHVPGGDPPCDLGKVRDPWRRVVHRCERALGIGRHHRPGRDGESDLFRQLPHGGRAPHFLRVAEPPLGQRPVRRVDGAARERNVPGEEPMVESALDHEDLRAAATVSHPDHRGSQTDHVAHDARCYPASRSLKPWTRARPSRRPSETTAR